MPNLTVYPASLDAVALSGSVQVNETRLFPSPAGNLNLLANGNVGFGDAVRIYESDPGRVANPLRPVTSLDPLQIPGSSAEIHLDDAAFPIIPLHKNDSQPVRIVAETGSIVGNSQPIFLPKQAQFIAGKDISNLNFDGKNLNANDLTLFQAGRDIIFDIRQDASSNKLLRNSDRIYRDPITGMTAWGLVREQGRITGVFSLSKLKPLKRDGFTREFVSFANAEQYTKWRFIHSLSAIELSGIQAGKPGAGAVGSVPPNVAQPAPGVISPPVSPTKPKNRSALCGNQLAIESTQCRESCGELTGPTCHICFTAASEAYGACLRN